MTTLEIILLVFGVVVFIASFVMPETQSELEAEDRQLTKEQIQEMLKEEMKHVHEQVTDVIDETVSYSVEKSERALERLTNDKIQAISEYSGTVLEDIHKNHEETMFLYDMLSDKHENLKSAASEVSQVVKQANETVTEVKQTSEQAKAVIDEVRVAAEEEAPKEEFEPMAGIPIERVAGESAIGAPGEEAAVTMTEADMDALLESLKPTSKTEKKPARKSAAKKTASAGTKAAAKTTARKKAADSKSLAGDIALHFDGVKGNENNNEQILVLHNQGKSNMAIAKQLGLGIGEVNLVIGLYEEI